LVAFDDKIFRIVQARAFTEIFWNAADQVTGLTSGLVHNPREQRRRRRFSMSAGDDEIVTTAQEIILQHLWQGHVEQLAVQHRFYLRVATRHRVANHHDVRIGWNVLRAVPSPDRDSFSLKKS